MFEPAFPGQQLRDRLSGPTGAVVDVAEQGMNPKVFQVRVASCLSECAVTSLASRSITNRPASVGFRYRLG